ncbi:MAG TPA: hypothetical protein DDY14_11275 [Chromatiaceae bacterium]|jgi:hypothetical protein|nr:hypothetical protein [Chromatiaceae bacterium]HCS89529.1 hypothetical protein [Chromatiaceae bacterium]
MPKPTSACPALSISGSYEVRLSRYARVALSIPVLESGEELKAKDLLNADASQAEGRYSVHEHVRFVVDRGLVRGDAPLLVLGMRNSLVNLRAPVIWHGRPYAVAGEQPEMSLRPYYGLGLRDGSLVLDCALGDASEAASWLEFFCAGNPVLWDDARGDELFDLLLCETADHSHLFDIPRGHHHLANEATRALWSRLHVVFEQHLYSKQTVAAAAMRKVVSECVPPLSRCNNYFHAAIGIDSNGGLVCLFGNAQLEAIGQRLHTLGCHRGICVENSGSVTPTWFPSGLAAPGVPLVRAPNFRERGRAVVVIELDDDRFDSVPGCWSGNPHASVKIG